MAVPEYEGAAGHAMERAGERAVGAAGERSR
jgi:hypothetical protein